MPLYGSQPCTLPNGPLAAPVPDVREQPEPPKPVGGVIACFDGTGCWRNEVHPRQAYSNGPDR